MMLIHLVSEQTLQNLLPTLALLPDAILQVRSNDKRFHATPLHLEGACRKAGLSALQFHPTVTIPSESPLISETETVLNQIRARHPAEEIIVNLTGGTKLMSIGAYRFAEYHRLPSLYTDTQNRRAFVDAETGAWPRALPALQSTVDRLTVPVVMAAQGKTSAESTISDRLLQFGLRAWDLRSRNQAAVSTWVSRVREAVPRTRAGRVSSNLAELQDFLARPLSATASDAAADYLDAAVEGGILRVDLSGRAFLNCPPQKKEVEQYVNLLDGGWLELAVAGHALTGTRFRDVHWSITPAFSEEHADYGETDLVLMDRHELRLAIVSCKSSLTHISHLEHLSSWRDRARTLGGLRAAAHVCVFAVRNPDEGSQLKQLGAAMNLKVHLGDEIRAFFGQ